jgi:hypothetical protein
MFFLGQHDISNFKHCWIDRVDQELRRLREGRWHCRQCGRERAAAFRMRHKTAA